MSGPDDVIRSKLLQVLEKAGLKPGEALELLNRELTPNLDFARVDAGRGITAALPEIVLASGKSMDEISSVVGSLHSRSGLAVVSRVDVVTGKALEVKFPGGRYHSRGRLFHLGEYNGVPETDEGSAAVVSAGTSDLHAAEEAAVLLDVMKVDTKRFFDVGVAGIHRLGNILPDLRQSRVCLVFAGMDAALPTVLGGLFRGPVVAIPTSTGYGTAFGGVTALLSMLNSFSPGITVLNIDNGIGAAAAALRILRGARECT